MIAGHFGGGKSFWNPEGEKDDPNDYGGRRPNES